jgi:hypothetical protein
LLVELACTGVRALLADLRLVARLAVDNSAILALRMADTFATYLGASAWEATGLPGAINDLGGQRGLAYLLLSRPAADALRPHRCHAAPLVREVTSQDVVWHVGGMASAAMPRSLVELLGLELLVCPACAGPLPQVAATHMAPPTPDAWTCPGRCAALYARLLARYRDHSLVRSALAELRLSPLPDLSSC